MTICPYNAFKALTILPFFIKCEHEKDERNTIWNETKRQPVAGLFVKCLVLAKVDTFMNNKKCVKQCERVQQSTARSSN